MLSWLAKRILIRNMARLREGDYRPLLRGDAKHVRFRFPGDSSFAADLVGFCDLIVDDEPQVGKRSAVQLDRPLHHGRTIAACGS